jgi:hypothetical protein
MLHGGAGVAGAARQAQHLIFPRPHVVERLQGGRRRAEYDRNLLAVGAIDGQVARMVAPAFLLFIRAVVFFIDHDNAQIFKRGEQ